MEEGVSRFYEDVYMLLDAVSQPVFLADMDGSVLFMNRAGNRLFGIVDCTGLRVAGIIEFPWERILMTLKHHDDPPEHIDVRLNTIHGVFCAELSASPLKSDLEGLVLVLLNVTDNPESAGLRNTRAALLESEARNRALIAAIPDIMFRVNSKGEYLDRMLKGKIKEIFPLDVAENALPFITKAVKSREIGIYEYPVTVAGREEYYEARFVAMAEDEILVILRRVTERKTAMMELESARREAEHANSAKSEFLANMSHEIRTPLNSITGFIELLMRSRLNDSQKEFLGIIRKSASGLLDIINDILDFSKIESHKLELNYVEFNPYTEFESVMLLFKVKAYEKGVRLTWFMDPLIPGQVVSDPLRLKQILANLLSNAIKFTPDDGAVSVEIRMLDRDETGCRIHFAVTDTGIGIPQRKQKQIFEAFMQADTSVTRRYGGTGLGLSISSNLVKLLGGELLLESETGRGSCFSFMVDCGSGCAPGLINGKGLEGINAGVWSGSVTDKLLLKGLAWFLERAGCTVTVSESIDGLLNNGFSLILAVFSYGNSGMIAEKLTGETCPVVLVCYENEQHHVSRFTGSVSAIMMFPGTANSMLKTILAALHIAWAGESAVPLTEKVLKKFSGSVLIGEDNKINQKLMTLLLRDYGIETAVAGNGIEVFDMYKKNRYDLVLMDINMPVADGFETARMIREYEEKNELGKTPIVALTAKVLRDDSDTVGGSGMDGYLIKPIEMERLETVLTEYLPPGGYGPPEYSHENPGALYKGDYNLEDAARELRISPDTLAGLSREFFRDLEESMAELKENITSMAMTGIRGISHKIKGASANLRFVRLSGLFSEIEEKSALCNTEFDYNRVIADIDDEINRLKSFF